MTTTTETTPRTRAARLAATVEQWHVAPEDQGQIIEIAYGIPDDDATLCRRTTDRSTGAVTYEYCDWDAIGILPGEEPTGTHFWRMARLIDEDAWVV